MFSEMLKGLREDKGMSQRELAEALGVTLRTIQYYESGEHIPQNADILKRIARTFDVPLYSLANSNEFYRMLRAESLHKPPSTDRKELYRLLQELTTLFAGGDLSPGDRELFLEAVTNMVLETDD